MLRFFDLPSHIVSFEHFFTCFYSLFFPVLSIFECVYATIRWKWQQKQNTIYNNNYTLNVFVLLRVLERIKSHQIWINCVF